MRIVPRHGHRAIAFNLVLAIAMAAAINFSGAAIARAQDASEQPPQAEANALSNNLRVDACASDPSRLGLSRIVEIDSANGPQFGANHGANTDFLKDGEVVLTFDDGPMRHHTRNILKALADHCTRATFFMVGRMAASDPAMVKEVAEAGHSVGSHTWSHKNLRAASFAKGEQDFEMGVSAVNRALGTQATPFFRFPYLGDNRQIGEHLKDRHISAWWVDVDSKDYLTRDPNVMVRRVMSALATKRKGIILMHDIQPSTSGGIRALLNQLHDKGFKVVHIVPKATVSSLPDYDQMVAKSFKTKAAAVAGNPLADRSIVWTAPAHATAPTEAGAANPQAAPSNVRPAKASPQDAAGIPSQGNAKPVAATPAAKSKPLPQPSTVEILPWQPQPFGY